MWTTVLEMRRPVNFDVVRQRILGTVDRSTAVHFGEHGEIAVSYTSNAASATEATGEALGRFAFWMLEAKLTLEPFTIRTHPTAKQVMPRLVGAAETARILGVTKARVSQLMHKEGFPTPVAKLKMGPVFLERAVQEYRHAREEAGRAD
ncbi:hypothetical protein Aab01nite_45270 [Paractinoplanes abujensis]|uniref:Helix-turn-helix domain-containing protein n=1 Tax=Paractinoplanes abujensis TaxID=882441 RepID=A0A7W7CN63_9ACTN|nr:hypothetical protein [Actinoplanes abujensis]MBB4690170.1 hypothetical protein [Actinoplanes abujensis]GID20937.1 hypothetical protein Aab01nite_45270 [Actinoplanes abujensis]